MTLRSPKKSGSYPDLTEETKFGRQKRKRPDDVTEEIRTLKEEFKQMFESWTVSQDKTAKRLEERLIDIQNKQSDFEKALQFVSTRNEELSTKYDVLEKKCMESEIIINNLKDDIENLNRNNKIKCIEIRNLPAKPNETKEELKTIISKLGATINVQVSSDNIQSVFRVPGSGNKPIVSELSSVDLKQRFLKAAKNYNVKNKANKLNSTDAGIQDSLPIYVAEHLTPSASRLHFLARQLAKSKQYKYCWTSFGRIFIRKAENTSAILIKNEAQIVALQTD